ncbi:hypothetical protein GQ55_9G157500 [Panicum hallii var. hallii]|uniref:Uncharacterized protein n=1 Tax=Panicum hallii var. hallii TaxID=1504633 RepID=A0A2T7C3L2_9POAL|nr:hypothetical protein GQ55_9G157500 [Panicum hallii var. hallii]
MATSPSPNPVGLWFCQISSGLQGRWSNGRAEPRQGPKNGAGGTEAARQAGAAGKDGGPPRSRTCRRDAMPEATVYLLLDRFAPS